MTVLSFSFFLALLRANFIIVDFPAPGFPFIHKKPRCSPILAASSQSRYSDFFDSHLHVLAWAFLIVIWRESICSNLKESSNSCFSSALSDGLSCLLSCAEIELVILQRAEATLAYSTSSGPVKRHISMWLRPICSQTSMAGKFRQEDISSTTYGSNKQRSRIH